MDYLRNSISFICKENNVEFIDWMNIVDEFKHSEKTIFAPFALYADKSHLSPKGNQLAAEYISKMLKKRKVI